MVFFYYGPSRDLQWRTNRHRMKVAVIGSGAAGITAARRLKEAGISFTVYEQTDKIGGTWVYTDQTGTDENGLPVHTSMYKELRTNIPKEVMAYPDFPIEPYEESFLPSDVILKYLHSYFDRHDLHSYVKFCHKIDCVSSAQGGWRVRGKNLKTKENFEDYYSAIIVATGHYHSPRTPLIDGIHTFKGEAFHSRFYRDPEVFKGKRVLVVGCGPSGLDMTLAASKTGSKVTVSHKGKELSYGFKELRINIPPEWNLKPEVKHIQGSTVEFLDGSTEEIDVIVYCTGYYFEYPFLNESSGIKVSENVVQPLYKHLININHPSMCLLGIPYFVCPFAMFDLQARFFISSLTGKMSLPSKEEMLRDTEEELKMKEEFGMQKKSFHNLGPFQKEYYGSLAELGGIESIPDVWADVLIACGFKIFQDVLHFREDKYRILDDQNFERH